MTDSYDGNGDYSPCKHDDDYEKQRKGGGYNGDNSGPNQSSDNSNHLNEKANEYIRDCINEKSRLDRKFPIAEKLLESEIEKVQISGRIPSREQKYADIYREKPLRISQKVLVPIREHPKFNFVGKLLGPKGNSLRRLQEETLCKMTVLGRNSMRDRVKEEELRTSKDPKYAHLNNDLHVEITTIAPPAEAYARIAYAMAELRKYLIPDSNDMIRQEQLRELMDNTGISENDSGKPHYKKVPLGNSSGGGGHSNANASSNLLGNNSSGMGKSSQHHGYRSSQQMFSKNNSIPKQKVLSILEKARTAMDDTYGRVYEDSMVYDPPYDVYAYGHGQHGAQLGQISGMSVSSRGPYENHDYEHEYNRRDYYQPSPSYGAQGSQPSNLSSNHNRSHVNR